MDDGKELNIESEEILDTQVIPNLSDEEADGKEYELIDESEEGGL